MAKIKPTDTSIWNLKNLASPTFRTLEYTKSEYDRLFGSTNYHLLFADNLKSTLNVFAKSREAFEDEKYILERLIYKNWNALRKERSMQTMKKIKSALDKFANLGIDKLSETLHRMTTQRTDAIGSGSMSDNKKLNVPSREVIEFYLTRLVSAHRLSSYACSLIRTHLEPELVRQMRNNVYLANNLLYLSASARIYCFMRRYQLAIAHVYNCLRDYVELFKSSGEKWIPDTVRLDFPKSLNKRTSAKTTTKQNGKAKDIGVAFGKDDVKMSDDEVDFGEPVER